MRQEEASIVTNEQSKKFSFSEKVSVKKIKISFKAVNGLLGAIVLALFIFHLSCGISRDAAGVQLGKMKTNYNELSEENSRLDSKVSYLGSYDYLKDKITALEMVKVDKIKIITDNGQVAKK